MKEAEVGMALQDIHDVSRGFPIAREHRAPFVRNQEIVEDDRLEPSGSLARLLCSRQGLLNL